MKVVKVYGALRELLGQCRFELDVTTPGQAIKALCVNFPHLERWLLDSEKDGVGYRVTVGRQLATEADVTPLFLPFGEREVFSITPVIAGAGGGRGFGMVLLGAALIGVAAFSGGAGLFAGGAMGFGATTAGGFAAATFGVKLAVIAGNLGIALVLGGVAQMLSPTPEFGGDGQQLKDVQRLQSFSFSGISNTARQGGPVPVVLGRAYAGSVVISSGLDVEQ